jgi:hypothetical protein
MRSGVILQGRMRKRGKYGLTIVFNTNKIGGFRLFYLVSTNSMTAATRCPGSTRAQLRELRYQQLFEDRSGRIHPSSIGKPYLQGLVSVKHQITAFQTPKTPEKHHPTQKGGGPLGSYAPGRSSNIYYNQSRWTGVVQYKNGVIHRYFPNSIGKLLVMWYKLIRL